MEKIKFSKLHGLGNDYIYIDMTTNFYKFDSKELAIKMSDRHFGVGGDGLIIVENSSVADFRMRMYNADGTESEMCGNGIRCFARFIYEHRLTAKKKLEIETGAGVRTVELLFDKFGMPSSAKVDMGEPILEGKKIPTTIDKPQIVGEEIEVDGRKLKFTLVSMGNPHCVIFVDEITDEDVRGLGPKIETHELFPNKVNVEFIKVINREHITMRVWERGSGETMACGTGASAAVVSSALNKKTGRKVKVNLPGGQLDIEWAANNHVFMTGPCEEVYEGLYFY